MSQDAGGQSIVCFSGQMKQVMAGEIGKSFFDMAPDIFTANGPCLETAALI
jgi:hypothetical protein